MNVAPARSHVERFRDIVALRLGLHFDDGKLDGLSDVLRERMATHGLVHFRAYENLLSAGERDEARVLAVRLTVGETYFFRYADHFAAFSDVVLSARARSHPRRIRVLSAGCASGEELYSLAIMIRQRVLGGESWEANLLGVDVNPAVLEKARRGRYSTWSLRDTQADIRARFFRAEGREFQLDETVCSMASFEERNLVDEDPLFWRPDAFDVVFCRNVTMYLSPQAAAAVVRRIGQCLSPGGFLFLGHAETLRGVSQDFHLCHTHETFYYQHRDAIGEAPQVQVPSRAPRSTPPQPLSAALSLDDTSWIGAIQRASDRIAHLSRGPAVPAAQGIAPDAPTVVSKRGDLAPAIELLRQERFVEAIDRLPTSGPDPDALLLRAVLLTNSGRLSDAEQVCREILLGDDLNSGAHYLMALCREHIGDRASALEHDQAATYLDAEFAMPHLHLGLLARRAGDMPEARLELARALALLAREDPSRILLFGGGFTREALVDLCRSEIRRAGGVT